MCIAWLLHKHVVEQCEVSNTLALPIYYITSSGMHSQNSGMITSVGCSYRDLLNIPFKCKLIMTKVNTSHNCACRGESTSCFKIIQPCSIHTSQFSLIPSVDPPLFNSLWLCLVFTSRWHPIHPLSFVHPQVSVV